MTEAKPMDRSDPLIDEVRSIRAELHAKFPNDLKAYVDHVNRTSDKILEQAKQAGPAQEKSSQ